MKLTDGRSDFRVLELQSPVQALGSHALDMAAYHSPAKKFLDHHPDTWIFQEF